MTRRKLLKNMLQLSLLASFSQAFFTGIAKAAGKCSTLIDLTGKSKDPNNAKAVAQAKGLQYVADIDKAVKAGTTKRKDKDDKCGNCQFFTKTAEGCGKCILINFGEITVNENGWCISWTRKI
ncbi:MAG: high-potential iron-sulfur protein [Bdellovibrionaceae bacterium]|nr:high-potential iron-sulfur protein [Pseudobdellovibrionaceae bacterium]